MSCPKHPQTRLPFWSTLTVTALKRQHETHGVTNAALENTADSLTLLGVVELIVLWVDIDRELPLLQHVGHWILIRTNDVIGIDRQATRQFLCKFLRVGLTDAVITIRIGDPLRIVPEQQSVGTPVTTERPTRQ